jgi:hypothetical protein
MPPDRRHLKRTIDVDEALVFDGGRITLHYRGRRGQAYAFELCEGGATVSRSLYQYERLQLDGGRITVEPTPRSGRHARLFVSMDPAITINQPGVLPDEHARADDVPPPFGGYV